jgi:hypothetical protein
MPANKVFNFGPLALTATYTTNILNPATVTGGVNSGTSGLYIIIYHIRIVNKTSGAVSFRLFKGLTGANTAGTELIGYDLSIPANTPYDAWGRWRFDTTDFLVGGASALTSLTIEGEGEVGVSG